MVIIDQRITNTWFDKPVLSTVHSFERAQDERLRPIVVSRELAERSNHRLRMNGVEGLTMTGHPGSRALSLSKGRTVEGCRHE